MKITSVEVRPHQLRYKESFSLAKGKIEGAPLVFLFISTDEGLTGGSYAPGSAPFIDGETEGSVMSAITGIAGPLLRGRNPFDIEQIMTDLDKSLVFNYRVKAGIELALYDLIGKALKVPLFTLWGGLCRDKVPVIRMVGIASPEIMAQKANDLKNQGFKYLKVKIGKDYRRDFDRISAIRDAVGPGVRIYVDANQGYSVKEAVTALNSLERLDITLVEQPVRADDLEGMAQVRRSTSIPVEADESVRTLSDALNVVKLGAADFISLKPFKSGGFRVLQKIAHLCEAANIKCLIGTTPGSALIDAANAHFLGSSCYMEAAAEIGESFRMENDPVTGFTIADGYAFVPQGPGIGVALDMESIEST